MGRRSQGMLAISPQDIMFSDRPRESMERIQVPASPESVLPPLLNQPLTPQSETEKRIRMSFAKKETEHDLLNFSTLQNEDPPSLTTEPSPLAPPLQDEMS